MQNSSNSSSFIHHEQYGKRKASPVKPPNAAVKPKKPTTQYWSFPGDTIPQESINKKARKRNDI